MCSQQAACASTGLPRLSTMVEAVHTLPVVALGMHGIALGDRRTSTAQPRVCQSLQNTLRIEIGGTGVHGGKKTKANVEYMILTWTVLCYKLRKKMSKNKNYTCPM